MNDDLMRRVLRITAVANLGAAFLFAFPGSLGRFAGLPSPAPMLYTVFLAFLVALYGATYAWLAQQPIIDRPLVAFSAIGKTGFVAVVVLCWLLGEVSGLAVVTASGDLVFAALFTWWLYAGAATPARSQHGTAARSA